MLILPVIAGIVERLGGRFCRQGTLFAQAFLRCQDGSDDAAHLAPYTIHPTPYTLQPTHYTLRPTPYAPHLAPYTIHPTPYTLQPTHYTLHPTPHTLCPTSSAASHLVGWGYGFRVFLPDKSRSFQNVLKGFRQSPWPRRCGRRCTRPSIRVSRSPGPTLGVRV